MIENPRVIVLERTSGNYAIAITNGSDDFHDAVLMVSASYVENGEALDDLLENALFFAAKRILQLEKGGYSAPPSGGGMACSGSAASLRKLP